RDGFVAIMPLIIIGSLAILVNNFPPLGKLDLVECMNGIFGEGNWQAVGGSIWNGTFAILGLLVAFSVAYNLAKSYNVDGLSAGLISTGAYIMLVPVTDDGGLAIDWLGAQGLFVAIVIALVLTELFRFLVNSNMTIKMPEGVPEGVARSFTALIPAIIILIVVGLFQASISVFAEISIFELIFNIIQEPLQGLGNTLPAAIIISLLNHLLWFFGLYGTIIILLIVVELFSVFISVFAEIIIFEFIFNIIQEPLQGLGNTLPAAIIISLLNHLLWFFGLHGTNIIGSVIEPLYLPLIEQNLEM